MNGRSLETWGIAISIFTTIGTSSAPARTFDIGAPPAIIQQTNTGVAIAPAESSGAAIGELRRRTGLTWDQLTRLFGVSRRSLHFWASGKPMTSTNEEHLQRVLSVVREIDRGDAAANRAELLTAREGGVVPFDMLANGDYERVVALVGIGLPIRRIVSPPLSEDAVRARTLPSPDAFVGDVEDRVRVKPGRLLASRPLVKPRRT
jgi:DNA-binding transcriptional regulator YiaG